MSPTPQARVEIENPFGFIERVRVRIPFATATLSLATSIACASSPEKAIARSAQLIVVTAPNAKANHGTLVLYERAGDAKWRRVSASVPVMLGRNGLKGASKREGDGCAPAGVFALERIHGRAPALPGEGGPGAGRLQRFPYRPLTMTTEGIDDPRSRFYNRIVDEENVPARQRDWTTSEKLRPANPLFRWLVEVRYNWEQEPGRGSCIYLHIWKGPGVPTSGCTAMSAKDLERIVLWLDSEKRPLLIQLTEQDAARRIKAPGL